MNLLQKFFSTKTDDCVGQTMLDFEALYEYADFNRDRYRAASPFPHILIEELIKPEYLEQVLAAFPTPDQELAWRKVVAERDGQPMQYKKLGLPHELQMASVIRELLWEMNSIGFLTFLERLTGIQSLISDPMMQGGGLHQIMPGGLLGVHADFTTHKVYGLDRRINVLLYLNKDWKPEYEGHLELWSRDMSRCVRRIIPKFGRCVIFDTDASSYHGHPRPLNCPDGMTRKSIALYYYTNGRDDAPVTRTTDTDWQHTPNLDMPPLE
jgi:Rps23 Pro-64 3,4-dihydroxylase Tpa1-like proline 4-hydroxylase